MRGHLFYRRQLCVAAAISGLTIGCSTAAMAQQAAASDQATADQSGGLEEITVTARKREEKLQDVPLDISVVSQATLQQQNITRIEDIARFIPGFHVDDTGTRSFNKPFIRGITTSSIEFYQAKVKTFVDGVLVAGDASNSMPFSELSSVEILKGPQATAFGRGTIGGAISYTTMEPTNYLSAQVSADVRQFGETSVNALISGPIIPDVLKGYVNARIYNYAGFLTNSYDGSHLGSESTKYISSKAVYTPVDWLTVKAYGSYDYDRDSIPAFQFASVNLRTNLSTPQTLAVTGGAPIIAFVGPLTGPAFKNNTYDPYNQVLFPGLKRESYRTALTATADLGFATLTSISSYNQSHEYLSYNSIYGLPASVTGEPVNPVGGYALNLPATQRDPDQAQQQNIYKDLQQEFRLTSTNDGPFKWLAGFNYFNYQQNERFPVFAFSQIFRTTSFSGYGLLSYDLLDNLTVTAEGRYNYDTDGLVALFYKQKYENSFYRFLPRLSVDYHLTPDVSVYAVFSEGSSPGFFNANLTGALAPFTNVGPEYLYNYEVGAKSTWFQNQLQANISLYREDYKNQQLITSQIGPNLFYNPATPGSAQYTLRQIYENAAASQSQGVELDIHAAPAMIPGLKFHGDMAWTRAVFQNYCSATQFLINPFPTPAGFGTAPIASGAGYTGCVSVAGHYLAEQPEWMAAMGVSYTRPVTDVWTLITSVDWSYIGRKFTDETNISWTAPSEIVNLHIGAKSSNITVDAFVLNATNEDAPAYAKNFANQGFLGASTNKFAAFATQGVEQRPRQFGVKVTYDFGAPTEAAEAPQAAYAPPPVAAPAPMAHSYMVFFDFNKSDLTSQATAIVDQAAKNAGPAKVTKLEVTGHTDTVGSDAYNVRLSRRRAESVAAQLEKDGIPSSEIEIVAKGKRDLLVPTADGVKEPQNRRVQIVYEGGATS